MEIMNKMSPRATCNCDFDKFFSPTTFKVFLLEGKVYAFQSFQS